MYANSWAIADYYGQFNYIVQDPYYNAGAIAAYIAAFDGHKKVFLLGFDGIDDPANNYNVFAGTNNYPSLDTTISEDFWVKSLATVMSVYNDTEFIRVMPTASFRTPKPWRYFLNFRQIDFRQFVIEADI